MDGTLATKHIIHPNGDVIIHLRNSGAPFAVLKENEKLYVDIKQMAQQSQPPGNGVQYKPVTVAPPGPGKNAVASEAQEEPSTARPEIYFQVSSAHLTFASPYFEKALGGPFKESQPGSDGLRHVDASDWDVEALLIVLRIIHGRNRQVPKSLSLEMLAKVAVIVDYYKCYEIADAFAEIWFQRIKGSLLINSLNRDLILLIHVSLIFRWADEFKAATKIALLHSKGPLRTLGLPIPEKITSAIDALRTKTLYKIGSMLVGLAVRYSRLPSRSPSCASMNLGALLRQIETNKNINGLANSLGTRLWLLTGKSVALTTEAAQNIRTPSWYHRCPAQFCDLNKVVNLEMDKLEQFDGLSLEHFAQTA
ncbi:hypothetical protein O1611_g5807 [Lasiodiplodia mahajangana]|uniref:Uncharacterized protein n=1 Tax=Lasiodiplodia mahajangana TaxID=1108764 RepID=A0ACC2JKB8_9PEZI|nr:hypothetical protein O1611_g5807 [Lasiodiplodia mahajangana]